MVCLCGLAAVLPALAQQNRNNPFETIPPAAQAQQPAVGSNVIEGIEFRGARRIPQDTLRLIIFSRAGDVL